VESPVDITCFQCLQESPLVDADAATFVCMACGVQYQFLRCAACSSVIQAPARLPGGTRVCDWCGTTVRAKAFGRKDPATATDWRDELEQRGLWSPTEDDVIVGGFRILGGSGFGLARGAVCSVVSLGNAIDVRVEIGGDGVASILYTEITDLDIVDGTTTRGGGFVGIGSGLLGALQARAAANLLNQATTKTKVNTGLAIGSVRGEVLLSHDYIRADDLRRRLSSLFTRVRAAGAPVIASSPDRHTNRDHSVDAENVAGGTGAELDLQRLADLRDKGLLTDQEFEAARSRAAKRLIDGIADA
jgi:hypothetical protein